MKTAQPGTRRANGNGSAAQMPITHTITPRRHHQGPPNGQERREIVYSGRHDYLPHDAQGRLLPGAHQGPELKKPRKAPTNGKLRFEIAPTVRSHKTVNGQVIFPAVITAEQSGKLGDMTEQEIIDKFGSNYLRIETQAERNERLQKAPTREPHQETHQEPHQEPHLIPRPMSIQDFAERFISAYENQTGLMREILRRLDERAPTQAQEPQQVENRTQEPRRTDPGKRAVDRTRAHQERHQEPAQAAHQGAHQGATRAQTQEPPRAAKPAQAAPDNSKFYFIDVNKVTPKQMFGIIKNTKPETVHVFGTGDLNADGAKRKLEILREHDVKAITPAQAEQMRVMPYADIVKTFGAHDFVMVPLLAQEPQQEPQPAQEPQPGRSVRNAINAQGRSTAATDLEKLENGKRMNVNDRNKMRVLRDCLETDRQWMAAKMENRELQLMFGDHSAKFKRVAMDAMRRGMPTREANNYAARLAYGDKAEQVII